jgi:uncharacterized UPF0160 family protein
MTRIATHSGPFHADDVFAVALLRRFRAPGAEIVRTRDLARIGAADLVVDVGGTWDPDRGRFDHHQASYTGPLSSAGMVLDQLAADGRISAPLRDFLASRAVDYIDAVDNGRVAPRADVPCFPRMVEAANAVAQNEVEFDAAFLRAVDVADWFVTGLVAEHERALAAEKTVRAAMDAAAGPLLELGEYINWKPAYFANGGATHPTAFVLFPGTDGTWRVVAIPPREGDFGQKVPLPAAWAGKTDAALAAETGVPGSLFCHKNRFIAVFSTREAALDALRRAGLVPA